MGAKPAAWRIIANQISERIRDGVFSNGDRLPGETRLAQEFGVHRHTVRRALMHLENSGLVRSLQGRGTFVQERRILYPVDRRTRATAALQAMDQSIQRCILEVEERPASERVASLLDLRQGESVVRMDVASTVDGVPFSRQVSFLPRHMFPRFAERFEAEGLSFTRAFATYGIEDYFRDRTLISAEPASMKDAEALGIPVGSAMLLTEYVNRAGGRAVQYAITRFVAATTQLAVESPERGPSGIAIDES